MRITAAFLAPAFLLACSNDDKTEHRHVAPPAPPKDAFNCRKISGGPGEGRTCTGPGFVPHNTTDADLFEATQAWCITQRVSWTNAHSMMRCVPTQEECKQDLLYTPAGKQNLFVRTRCAQTSPGEWSEKQANYSRPDGFVCKYERGAQTCSVFPAEMMDPAERVYPEAWCYEGPEKGEMFNLQCFGTKADCDIARVQRSDAAECTLRDAAYAMTSEYGHLDR